MDDLCGTHVYNNGVYVVVEALVPGVQIRSEPVI